MLARGEADHCLVVGSTDPLVVKEGHVTAYHLLWELVHVFFDSPEASRRSRRPGSSSSTRSCTAADATPVRCSTRPPSRRGRRSREIVELRRAVGADPGTGARDLRGAAGGGFAAGATLLAFGNGGSSTDAQDVVHTFVDPPPPAPPLPALGLTNDVAVVTALSNDVSFDVVFSRQVRAFGRPGDIAIGAVDERRLAERARRARGGATSRGMVTVGLAGYGGGRMAELAAVQHMFAVPSSSVHRVQEVQTTLYHVLWEATQVALGLNGGRLQGEPRFSRRADLLTRRLAYQTWSTRERAGGSGAGRLRRRPGRG